MAFIQVTPYLTPLLWLAVLCLLGISQTTQDRLVIPIIEWLVLIWTTFMGSISLGWMSIGPCPVEMMRLMVLPLLLFRSRPPWFFWVLV